MSTLHLSDSLLDGYVALFRQLEPKDQTILLNKLAESAEKRSSIPAKRGSNIPEVYFLSKPADAPPFAELCGSWQDDRSAEEIIEDLRKSRIRTREVNL